MRAKSHDLRKGQWLFIKMYEQEPGIDDASIVRWIRNMENDEFDKLMEDYNK